MQERNLSHRGSDQSNADCKKRRNEPKRRNVLAKKIGAIISSACGSRRKSQEMCVYTSDEAKECMEEKERPISEEHQLALNKTHPCEEIQVAKVHAMGRQKGNARICKGQSRKAAKRHPTVSLSLSGIFRKSTGFNLRKWKTTKNGSNANGTKGSGLKPSYGRITRANLGLKRDERQEEKTMWHEEKANEAEETNRELELCKKRILMGEKCRPLNLSGVLHYDKEGIFLPDVLPSEES
ncbi:hypothetical protein Pfo_002046 [Paulownia fortunei]|nr:hypothetical protein Pfo_002046 [Paulownia fortunei]